MTRGYPYFRKPPYYHLWSIFHHTFSQHTISQPSATFKILELAARMLNEKIAETLIRKQYWVPIPGNRCMANGDFHDFPSLSLIVRGYLDGQTWVSYSHVSVSSKTLKISKGIPNWDGRFWNPSPYYLIYLKKPGRLCKMLRLLRYVPRINRYFIYGWNHG